MSATEAQLRAFNSSLDNNPTNFTIKIEGYSWRIHDNVIDKQSTFFNTICNGPFKESTDKQVVLHDDCPWIIGRMVHFIYSNVYFEHFTPQQPTSNVNASSSIFSFAASVQTTTAQTSASGLETDFCRIMEVGKNYENYAEQRLTDQQRSKKEVNALVYQLSEKYDISGLRTAAVAKLLQDEYSHEDSFFMVANIIGLDALRREDALLKKMVTSVSDHFGNLPAENSQFKDLLGTDPAITMMTIDHIYAALERVTNINTLLQRDLAEEIKSLKDDLQSANDCLRSQLGAAESKVIMLTERVATLTEEAQVRKKKATKNAKNHQKERLKQQAQAQAQTATATPIITTNPANVQDLSCYQSGSFHWGSGQR